jgi:coenzyme F420 hydrogenase subunit beta
MIIHAQIGPCGTCITSPISEDVYFVAHSLTPDRKGFVKKDIESIPSAQVGIIDGPICLQKKEESIHIAELVREKVDTLLGIGTCAVGDLGGFITEACSQSLPFFCPFLRTRHPKIESYIHFDYKLPVCSANQEGIKKCVKAVLENNASYMEYFQNPPSLTVSAITESGSCIGCGTCGIACPTQAIDFLYQPPVIHKDICIQCGACFVQCPRSFGSGLTAPSSGARYDPSIGAYQIAAKAQTCASKQDDLQKIIANLISYLFEETTVDAAVMPAVNAESPYVISPTVVTTPEQVQKTVLSNYSVVPSVLGIKNAVDCGYQHIAFVGLPCQIQGIFKAGEYPLGERYYSSKIDVLISMFCMKNFLQSSLKTIVKKMGVSVDTVKKMGIIRGKFRVESVDNIYEIPVDAVTNFQRGCSLCLDFSGELSDISVGTCGSLEGYTSIIVRTKKGNTIFEGFKKRIQYELLSEYELEIIRNRAAFKKRENKRTARTIISSKRFAILGSLQNMHTL